MHYCNEAFQRKLTISLFLCGCSLVRRPVMPSWRWNLAAGTQVSSISAVIDYAAARRRKSGVTLFSSLHASFIPVEKIKRWNK